MSILRNLLVGLAGLVVLLVVVGLFLPDKAHVERSLDIDAAPGEVYAVLSSFSRFNEWSPWYDLDPSAEYQISGSAQGVGARYTWASDDPSVGSGSQEIIAVETNRLVRVSLDFGSQGTAVAEYRLEPLDATRTRVTWGFDTEFGLDLFGRYMGLLFNRWIGRDYERGLANLKTLLEAGQ